MKPFVILKIVSEVDSDVMYLLAAGASVVFIKYGHYVSVAAPATCLIAHYHVRRYVRTREAYSKDGSRKSRNTNKKKHE